MFPETDSRHMYATRVPFEESTIYSRVHIGRPNLVKFANFKVRT